MNATKERSRMRARAAIQMMMAAVASAGLMALGSGQAFASPVGCGETITHDTTLKGDLTNCPGDGLVIGADNITLNLNGHTIDGTVSQADCDRLATFRVGIRDSGYDGLTIENGSVQQFDEGLAAGDIGVGMSDSRLHGLALRNNRFGGFDLGGSRAADTQNDQIEHNVVSGTGCGTGIKLNTTRANRVADNRVQNDNAGIVVCCSGDSNVINRNAVSGGQEDGILVFAETGARVVDNSVSDVGGDGAIEVNGNSTGAVVRNNAIARSLGAAISIDSCCGSDPGVPTDIQVARNSLTSVADGIILFETDRDQISDNSVRGSGTFGGPFQGFGVLLDGSSGTVVNRNTISGGRSPGIGISIGLASEFGPSPRPVAGDTVTRNVSNDNGTDGIVVQPVAHDTALERNTAHGNGADGIHVLSPFTTITRNEADLNAALGIDAVAGVTDGGHNHASGNGNAAQCMNVLCN